MYVERHSGELPGQFLRCDRLPRPYATTEWADAVKEGETMHARIVLVDQGSKSIRLSMRPHIMEMRAPNNLPALGKNLT